jgi:ribosomal-protein-alanine N-acetyltransferase
MPSHRGQGIAKEFIRQIEQWCRERKASAMMLEVKVDNVEAIGLYESLGYMKISIRMDYFGAGLDAQVMRKELS